MDRSVRTAASADALLACVTRRGRGIVRKTWMLLALMTGLAGCASQLPQHRIMLDGEPWPLDANGHIVTGTTVVFTLIDYRGVVVEACIEQSSGNDALDKSAIRRMAAASYHPEIKSGFPASSYVLTPVTFGPTGTKSAPLPNIPEGERCETKPLLGISAAEVAAAEGKRVTIFPTPAGVVPDVGQPWPTDMNGVPINVDVYTTVLVDKTGHIISVGSPKPNNYAAFNAMASQAIAKMTFASGDVEHWTVVGFHFRANK